MKSQSYLNTLFYYRDGVLYRKVKRGNRLAGAKVGCPNGSGYLLVYLDGKLERVHRVIWTMFKGPIPEGMQVDHINHDRSDNHIENLRLVTNMQNAQNKKMRPDNTSGTTGVYFNKSLKLWCARITINQKVIMLGCRVDKDAAVALRKQAEIEYGFHPNHGLPEAA